MATQDMSDFYDDGYDDFVAAKGVASPTTTVSHSFDKVDADDVVARLEKRASTITHCENCGGDWVDNGLQVECFCKRIAELEEAARSLLNRASRPLNLGEILLQQALNGKDGD